MDVFAFVRNRFPNGGVARAFVSMRDDQKTVEVHTARPGIVIGNRGANAAALKAALEEQLGPIHLHIQEIRRMETEPILVADAVVMNLATGVAIDRILDKPIQLAKQYGAGGCRVRISGARGDHDRASEGFDESGADHARIEGTAADGAVVVDVWITPTTR